MKDYATKSANIMSQKSPCCAGTVPVLVSPASVAESQMHGFGIGHAPGNGFHRLAVQIGDQVCLS